MLFSDLIDQSPSQDTKIACAPSALSETERKRHEERSDQLFNQREEARKVDGGYAVRFPGTMDHAERILDFVRYERKCCPFLTFDIAFEPEERGIWLYLGGDEEVEDYITLALEEEFAATQSDWS